MRRLFLSIITISQFFGAVLTFAYFDEASKQSPLSTLGTLQAFSVGVTMLVYLLGLIGSMLIWLSRRAGLWLSLIHQLVMIPIFFMPAYFWVMGDALSIAAVVWKTGSNIGFAVQFNFSTSSLVDVLNARTGTATSYYGANIFALICAVYLNRLRRRGVFGPDDGG